VKGLATEHNRLGSEGPMDAIFDDHFNKVKCQKAWEMLKRSGHPRIRAMLGDTPSFRDSVTTMPLQAADLLTHWLRECQLKPCSDPEQFKLTFPWRMKSKEMKGLHIYFTPDMIKANFQRILRACVLGRAGVPPDIVSVVVSPPVWPGGVGSRRPANPPASECFRSSRLNARNRSLGCDGGCRGAVRQRALKDRTIPKNLADLFPNRRFRAAFPDPKSLIYMGWLMGREPTTTGITVPVTT